MPRYSQDSMESKFRNDLINALNSISEELRKCGKELEKISLSEDNLLGMSRLSMKGNLGLATIGDLSTGLGLSGPEINELSRRERERMMAMSVQKGEPDPNGKDKVEGD